MLLEVSDLTTHYQTAAGAVRAVDGVSFTVAEGETLGLVGESGCGKTTVAKSLLRVLPANASTLAGKINFRGQDLLTLEPKELNKVRWRELSMITQSAMNALDPVYRIEDQIIETLQVHTDVSKSDARERAAELFALVGLEPARLVAYPHELSGGMRQRAVIAIALALDPTLIIADEPTTALDVVVQDGILGQLAQIRRERGTSMILVTHDISVVAETCQRTAVMYAGHVAELGDTRDIFIRPTHPYTMGLLGAFPTLESATGELISIPGSPPNLVDASEGCRFAPRCPFAEDICRTETPPLLDVGDGQFSACHFADRAAEMREQAADGKRWQTTEAALATPAESTGVQTKAKDQHLVIEDVKRHFPIARSGFSLRSTGRKVHAVDGVSLEIKPGEIVGLAGESGSGKSTLGEIVAALQPATDGTVHYAGTPVASSGKAAREFRREVQVVFQDPYQTLNPRFSVHRTVEEPLRNFGIGDEAERDEKVRLALARAGLPSDELLERYPHELSGGQRQRVAIARGIVVEPTLLVADEPVSMLDVSIRAGVLNLFRRFRDELGMSILYVSHDLATIRYICDRTAVMYLGRIVEQGPTEDIITAPRHPYTELLLSAVPSPEPDAGREPVDARGEIPSPVDLPNGCRFHARCRYARAEAGWEGRDLLVMVDQRRIVVRQDPDSAWEGEPELLSALDDLQPDGTDLNVKVPRQVSADKVSEYLRDLAVASGRSIGDSIQAIDVDGEHVRVRFTRVEEPTLHQPTPGREVLCGRPPWCSGVGS